MSKLKDHLLPRIKTMLLEEQTSNVEAGNCHSGLMSVNRDPSYQERDSIFLQNDRIYRHQLARFNYTAYDVRRAQDVTNPDTSHCDIMILAKRNTENDSESDHPFMYARVLGIYHTNVVYIGEGMVDYQPRHFEFLWVWWFQYVGQRNLRLDSVRFPPVEAEDAFGFVDPTDVLRACHVIPAFAKGKSHSDGISISRCARDGNDWTRYLINWCVKPLFEYLDIVFS
jgi:hypothetical protein